MFLNPFFSKISLLTASLLLLTACGGGANDVSTSITSDSDQRPIFSRALAKASSVYQPEGDIQDTSPTFEWKAVSAATRYQFGHEDTDSEMRWQEYKLTAAEAGCETTDICSYTPDDFEFAIGDEKVWWVRAETSKVWQEWSSPFIFTVTDNSVELPSSTPISPEGVTNSLSPTFKWTPGNGASYYQIGMENFDATDWVYYTVSVDQANCQSTECSYTPNPSTLNTGDSKTWWVREQISGIWQNWSEGSIFTIDTNTAYIPFENTPDITNVVNNNGKWYGILDTEILEDDGENNISTIYANQYGFVSTLSVAVPGKLHFVAVKNPSTTGTGFGSDRIEELHSFTLDTHQGEIIFEDGVVSIVEGSMKDFLLVSKKRIPSNTLESLNSPYIYYKIDKEANLLYLGKANMAGFSAALDFFSVESVDYLNNVIHIEIASRPEITYKIITDAINIGLEDE